MSKQNEQVRLHEHLIPKTKAAPRAENVHLFEGVKITVITPHMIRLEFGDKAAFTDMPTQAVWFRDLGAVEHTVEQRGKMIEVKTNHVTFIINVPKKKTTYVIIDGEKIKCDNSGNLKGTTRTLDQTYGAVKLDNGVVSKSGVSIMSDSKSLLLKDNGLLEPRHGGANDVYIFAYGKDYVSCVSDFLRITGKVPLVPRYVLGNWWSRYYAYTQNEYISLMQRFEAEDIPLTVATIDMDWHWVDLKEVTEKKFLKDTWGASQGWTGYSWNTNLFPDYKVFLKWLQEHNLHVTVNLHPASGIREFEDMYEDMANAMGVDPKSTDRIEFDMTDPKFINNYFDVVHHPYEDDGVDFWWIDWQQGKTSKLKGLDPLWALNHYHFLDLVSKNKRPLILSRYALLGSHRYPLGFSGDTAMNWRVLDFQPYFTANATNCGYTWWSHDIGGHHQGKHSDELYIRWVQYGVFSPILRLHATSSPLLGKEPWNFGWAAQQLATEALRLRHRLIPYLYSMNYRTHALSRALCEPIYYTYPNEENAYKFKNEYFFGTELLVSPITSKLSKKTGYASTEIWLPEGRWTDFFTGRIYDGGKVVKLCRGIESIPVLAKEGAIVPMSDDSGNKPDNPSKLRLKVYRGTNSFSMYEDDGISNDYASGKCANTIFSVSESSTNLTFDIKAPGEADFLPEKRTYIIEFADVVDCAAIDCSVPYKAVRNGHLTIILNELELGCDVSIKLNIIVPTKNAPLEERLRDAYIHLQAANVRKQINYAAINKRKSEGSYKLASKLIRNKSLRDKYLEEIEAAQNDG